MSVKLSDTISWVQPFLFYKPVAVGTALEPAMTSANTIVQTILGAPFVWPWNRAVKTFNVTAQDTTVTINDFGFIEKATCKLAGAPVPNIFELDVELVLGLESETNRPSNIAVQMDDQAGSIVFRTLPTPDQTYEVTVTYQKAAPLFTALANNWPIPPRYQYLANYGFLALMQLYVDDPRYQITNAKFIGALLSASEGLSETDKSLWLGNTLAVQSQTMDAAAKAQQGTVARGS